MKRVKTINKIVVIGGGAAGLMAAFSAAKHGGEVIVLEKMPAIGKKILISGKGRCNFTNNCSAREFIENMPGNGQFLYSAFNKFNNEDVIEFFRENGLESKVERGGRVFPVSDKSRDVINAFEKVLRKLDVKVLTNQTVEKVQINEDNTFSVETKGEIYQADKVIITTGGASYPLTGSTGDGYKFAEGLGHTVVPLKPSLVPLVTEEEWVKDLQGLSSKNMEATAFADGVKIDQEFGEMLFTHFGLSGPIILSLSRKVAAALENKQNVTVEINLKPALSEEVLDNRLKRDFEKFSRKQIKNALNELLPQKLINIIIDLSFIDPEKYVNQITKVERKRLLDTLRKLTFTVVKLRPLSEAIVTAGGVSTKEINSSTMESKIVKGLYFAGEVIDIDGYTGGFNLQAAFSTGHLAGMEAATN